MLEKRCESQFNGVVLHHFKLLGFAALTDAEKDKINHQSALKSRSKSGAVLQAGEKFSLAGNRLTAPVNLDQLGEIVQQLLNDKNLEVSKVRPFFWSLVETYVDRFQCFPFDVNKALFSHLELNDFPEGELRALIRQLETLCESRNAESLEQPKVTGRKPVESGVSIAASLDEEVNNLRSCLKYATLVADDR